MVHNRYMFANFNTMEEASEAYEQLVAQGWENDQISVIAKEEVKKEYAEQVETDLDEDDDIGVGEGILGGAVTGGLIGLVVSAVPLVIAGLPSLIVVGPVAAALGLGGVAATTTTGAVAGAAVGGLVGALDNLGVEREVAKEYETTIQEGGVLLIAEVGADNEDSMREWLEEAGAGTVEVGEVRE